MALKSSTPICDLIRKLVSGGLSADMAIEQAREEEERATYATRAMAVDLETLNKRRAWDRQRRKKQRAESGGRELLHIPSLTTDSNLSVKKKTAVKSSGGMSGGQKAGRPAKGILLPDDWCPSSGHYAEGQRRGLTRQEVDDAADRMRNWTVAEGHRARARKDDRRGWDACFLGTWLTQAVDAKKRMPVRGSSLGDIAFRGQ